MRTLVLLTAMAFGLGYQTPREWNIRLHVKDDARLTGCGEMDVTIGNGEFARGEAIATPRVGDAGLKVSGFGGGAIYVRGGAPEYIVKLCKFAAADTAAEARTRLAEIDLSVRDGLVEVMGPGDNRHWMAHFIVLVPPNARVDLETHDGPLSVRAVSGRTTAHSTNGPVAIRSSSGVIRATSQNGPVDISGMAGDVQIVARNGPLTAQLSGDAWEGPGLDARADHGPLTVWLPEGYGSGVRVEMARRAPLSCRAALCADAVAIGDADRRLTIGASGANVRLSSGTGPVTIASMPR